MKYFLFSIAIASLMAIEVRAQQDDDQKAAQPVELGHVKWLRDLDQAVANSKEQEKPIAILFQEVPG
jgi:hypothetical protein